MSGEAAPLRPCGSCPYRRDVPSGVWSPEEYEKLPPYDNDTPSQPPGAFFCHQQDGRLCAGWVACHDMQNSLGLRLASAFGIIDQESYDAALDFDTPVPVFGSGADAAAHGLAEVEKPSMQARRTVARLERKLKGAR